MTTVLDRLRSGLVVSCQAYPGESMRHPETMAQVAQAVVEGGAVGVRLQGLDDIRLASERLDVPVIGLVKEGKSGVFITPTLELALATAEAGADIVALDGTSRPRPDGRSLEETISTLKQAHDVLVVADCDSLESATAAIRAGADILGTTLAGYTEARAKTEGPDFDLLAEIIGAHPDVPVIAEGRIHTPEQAAEAIRVGAHAVVVGTAITHPHHDHRLVRGSGALSLTPTVPDPRGRPRR